MCFFKKTMFGYSNTKNQQLSERGPSQRCRNIPSPTTGLFSVISSTGDILPSQPNILVSTAIRSPGTGTIARRAATLFDLNLEAEDGSISRNSGNDRALGKLETKADMKMFELCESLGFESSVERMNGGDLTVESYNQMLLGGSTSSSRLISRTSEPTFMRRNSSSSSSSSSSRSSSSSNSSSSSSNSNI